MIKTELLSDLDELVFRCRSKAAREAITEAVACYRVGAFRSCIVSTWNAVVWDYLDKLESLELQKDNEATEELNQWKQSVGSLHKHDINVLQNFERELPTKAFQKFEFISDFEKVDLERLREDRHRCAHPSFSRPEEIYQPNAELARTHLVHAVDYLLQNPPTQGQKALDNLLNTINSPYFPTSMKEAKESLEDSALAHARQSFVRNFVLVLIKRLLIEEQGKDRRQRMSAALQATFIMYRELVLKTWQEKLPSLLEQIPEEHLSKGIYFLVVVPESWNYWPEAKRNHWKRYIENLPTEDVDFILFYCLQIPQFREIAQNKIRSLDEDSMNIILYTADRMGMSRLPTEVIERTIELWKESKSFDSANRLARNTLPVCIPLLTTEMIKGLLQAVKDNSQLQGSTSLEPLLLKIRNREDGNIGEFDSMARLVDLNEMVDRWNGLKSQKQEDFDGDFVDKL